MNNEDKKNLLGVLTKFDWIWGRVRTLDSKYVYVSFTCSSTKFVSLFWFGAEINEFQKRKKNLLAQNHINIPKICMFFDQKCETTVYFLEIAYF